MYKQIRGFTLIELLVVIAIIALLLSILLPSLSKVKDKAKAVTCAAHLKQFGLAWYFYAKENDDSNIWYAPSHLWAEGHFWFYRLAPYLGGSEDFAKAQGDISTRLGVMKIMVCPSTRQWQDKYVDGAAYGAADMAWRWVDTEGAYTLNGWMQESSYSPNDDRFYRKFSRASDRTPLISDGGWVDAWPTSSEALQAPNLIDLKGAGLPGTYRMGSALPRLVLDRHSKGINILFKGNHVEKISLPRLWSLAWHHGFEPTHELELPSN